MTTTARHAAQSALVGEDSDRGAAIERRLTALGISDREWYARTKIDRKTLRRAIGGESVVRDSTYDAIEAALDRLEAHAAGQPAAVAQPADVGDMVEFTIEGNFGVRAVVKGPVRDMDQLEEAVARLLREMKNDPDSKS